MGRAMTRRSVRRKIATSLALLIVGLSSARVAAADGDDARSARPSSVDYVDGTVGMD
jgi:hypothetical protein